RPAARVNEEQPARVPEPVLLRVVAPKLRAVVECPGPDRLVAQPVAARRHIALGVVANRQEVSVVALDEGWLVKSPRGAERENVSVFTVAQVIAVKPAPSDRDAIGNVSGAADVERQKHRSVGLDHELRAGTPGEVE